MEKEKLRHNIHRFVTLLAVPNDCIHNLRLLRSSDRLHFLRDWILLSLGMINSTRRQQVSPKNNWNRNTHTTAKPDNTNCQPHDVNHAVRGDSALFNSASKLSCSFLNNCASRSKCWFRRSSSRRCKCSWRRNSGRKCRNNYG